MSTRTLTHGRVTWTNILDPTPEDLQQLSARYPQFHPLHVQDCLTEREFPKLDSHDDYLFLVVHMPFWDPQERVSRPAEIDIFIAQGTLVTSHRGELQPLVELFDHLQADEGARAELMGCGASPLLHHLLNVLVEDCFPAIHRVGHGLRHVEQNLFQHDTRQVLLQMAVVRRDIIALRSMLKPQQETMGELVRGKWPFIHSDLDPYWGDIGDHLAQLCATLDEYAEVVSGLSETVDTLASHRIDEVVRLLTIVTVLTLPVTLLATVFGMNIAMPFSEHPLLFYLVIGLGLLFTVSLVVYLRRRRSL